MSSKSTTDQKPGESFADWKSNAFKNARAERRENGDQTMRADSNNYHVQAKLPADLYQQFWALIKAKNFSKSTGVQYAIFQTLKNETNV